MNKINPLKTPVLFLVYNRIDTTKKVFNAIKNAKPPRIYISSDGPKTGNKDDINKVKKVREYILSNINWECEVQTLFNDSNLGCKHGVSKGIDWFFTNEDSGIILEDDCLPSQSFFLFCEELLERYRDDDDVFMISGDCRFCDKIKSDFDYSFVKYSTIWGWASWANVWYDYDNDMNSWIENKNQLINSINSRKEIKSYWLDTFEKTYTGEIDTWCYQLAYLQLLKNGKCILPTKNLITNIGFTEEATHTTLSEHPSANMERYDLTFPLRHPNNKNINKKLNKLYENTVILNYSIKRRILKKIKQLIRKISF